VWLRGIFLDDYGLHPRDIQWRSGGEETPGRLEKIKVALPPEIDLRPIPPGTFLSRMLDEGELDAIFTARAPSSFGDGSQNVKRLFPNYRDVEEEYFRRTGIFPIMHTIILQRALYEKNRWVAASLCKAFSKAKEIAVRSYMETAALHVTLPWIHSEVARTISVLGEDWWPYGIELNRKPLETFLRYHHEQGLSEKRMTIEDLFAPESLDAEFKI